MLSSTPIEIKKIGDQLMKIKWDDGVSSDYNALFLRQNCHCAACINELTGEKMLNIDSIPKDIKILKSDIVGNYAISFNFSDGHGSGIYSFDLLRRIVSSPAGEKG